MKLPIAKYMDSVIVRENNQFIEKLIDQVVGETRDEQFYWIYYLAGKDGREGAVLEDDILMNLTTGKSYVPDNFDIADNGDIRLDPSITLEEDEDDGFEII